MRIAAIIVLYNPDEEAAFKNILQYIDHVDQIIIWKNSPVEFYFPEKYNKKVLYIGTGHNEYMAKPLNTAVDWCVSHGIDYLLTMDQDSTWLNFQSFIEEVKNIENEGIVIYAPNVNDSFRSAISQIEVESVITSGSLCNVATVKELGGFREDYQIYWVDGEFCYWARLNGFKIQLLTKHVMKQNFGVVTKTKFGTHSANYSPIVYYFLFRNMIWMRREHKKGLSIKTLLYTSKLYISGIILGESHKCKKLSMIGRALYHGLFMSFKERNNV